MRIAYSAIHFMRAAPCCDPQVLFIPMVTVWGVLSACVRLRWRDNVNTLGAHPFWISGGGILMGLGLLLMGTSPASAAQQTLTLSDNPVLSLGPANGHEFYQVQSVVLLEDALVIADRGSQSVIWVSLGGTTLGRVGGEGGGPGEFRGLGPVMTCGDSLFAWDPFADRMSVLSDGEFVRSFRIPPIDGRLPQRVCCSGTDLLVLFGVTGTQELGLVEGPYRPAMVLHRFSLEGEYLGQVGEFPGDERYRHETSDGPRVFGKTTVLARTERGFILGTGDQASLLELDLDGQQIRSLGLGFLTEPLGREDLNTHKQEELERVGQRFGAGVAQSLRRNQEQYDYPESYPPYSAVLIDDDANVWVRRSKRVTDLSERWVVIGSDGQLRALVLPPRFQLMDVGRGMLAGVWKDDFDVEHVRAFNLRSRD